LTDYIRKQLFVRKRATYAIIQIENSLLSRKQLTQMIVRMLLFHVGVKNDIKLELMKLECKHQVGKIPTNQSNLEK
jgi:hypothetical protein